MHPTLTLLDCAQVLTDLENGATLRAFLSRRLRCSAAAAGLVSCSKIFRSKSSPSMPLCARARGMGRIHRLDRPLYAVELCV